MLKWRYVVNVCVLQSRESMMFSSQYIAFSINDIFNILTDFEISLYNVWKLLIGAYHLYKKPLSSLNSLSNYQNQLVTPASCAHL